MKCPHCNKEVFAGSHNIEGLYDKEPKKLTPEEELEQLQKVDREDLKRMLNFLIGKTKRLKDGHKAIMKEINDNPALHNDTAIGRLYTISEQALKEK